MLFCWKFLNWANQNKTSFPYFLKTWATRIIPTKQKLLILIKHLKVTWIIASSPPPSASGCDASPSSFQHFQVSQSICRYICSWVEEGFQCPRRRNFHIKKDEGAWLKFSKEPLKGVSHTHHLWAWVLPIFFPIAHVILLQLMKLSTTFDFSVPREGGGGGTSI